MQGIECWIQKNQLKWIIMAEEKKKKGFFSAIKESMDKSGGCCGAGETCGAAPDTSAEKEKKKAPSK